MKQHSREELEQMKKPELEKLAATLNLDVKRSDGKEGDPLFDDYVNAIAGASTQPALASNESASGAAAKGAKTAATDKEVPLDKTIPGGRYVNTAGEFVNANGKRITADGALIPESTE